MINYYFFLMVTFVCVLPQLRFRCASLILFSQKKRFLDYTVTFPDGVVEIGCSGYCHNLDYMGTLPKKKSALRGSPKAGPTSAVGLWNNWRKMPTEISFSQGVALDNCPQKFWLADETQIKIPPCCVFPFSYVKIISSHLHILIFYSGGFSY